MEYDITKKVKPLKAIFRWKTEDKHLIAQTSIAMLGLCTEELILILQNVELNEEVND